MADLYEVERAVVGLIAAALVSGPYQRGAIATTTWGQKVKIYRGWPEAGSLGDDMRAGIAHVNVFPLEGMTRNVTRWLHPGWAWTDAIPTITAAVAGATVTLGGSVTVGNVVGLQWGPGDVNSAAYVAQVGDTLQFIASTLAGKVTGASVNGLVITMPTDEGLAASVMTPTQAALATRMQDQGLRVTVWTSTPQMRDQVASAVDSALGTLMSPMGRPDWFNIKPNEDGWLRYVRTYVSDTSARDGSWRRDMLYTVEYPTTLIEMFPIMLFGGGTLVSDTQGVDITGHYGANPPF